MLEHFCQRDLNEWRQPVYLDKIGLSTIILDLSQSYFLEYLNGCMESPNPKFILYGIINESKDKNLLIVISTNVFYPWYKEVSIDFFLKPCEFLWNSLQFLRELPSELAKTCPTSNRIEKNGLTYNL